MAGTIPVDGNLTMEDLAATLTREEQLAFEQLTALTVDPSQPRNLATFIAQDEQLGMLAICATGAAAQGAKILSTTAYVKQTQTKIDVYRLPL
ncbi:MAG TPA: hypothetical protein VG225_12525 [Terracidiphilus sp.]|jgi:hypothetical protein|nr:hypothetical protein [Terracidiphilus sp.]